MAGNYSVSIFTEERLAALRARIDGAIDGPEAQAALRAEAVKALVKCGIAAAQAESMVPPPRPTESVESVLSDMTAEEVAILVRLGLGAAPSRLRQYKEAEAKKAEAEASA